jgi:hypothetical protein
MPVCRMTIPAWHCRDWSANMPFKNIGWPLNVLHGMLTGMFVIGVMFFLEPNAIIPFQCFLSTGIEILLMFGVLEEKRRSFPSVLIKIILIFIKFLHLFALSPIGKI